MEIPLMAYDPKEMERCFVYVMGIQKDIFLVPDLYLHDMTRKNSPYFTRAYWRSRDLSSNAQK